jgi:AraC family transcriptional regulator
MAASVRRVASDPGRFVAVRLDRPPDVVSVGVGIHGVKRRRDVFHLPDLWQLHLYGYQADLLVAGVPHRIRPGRVSLIPPGVSVQFLYRGRSEHLYAHLRMGTGDRTVPVLQDAGAETPALSGMMRQAVAAWPRSPARATAELWAVLWRVAQLGASQDATPAPVAAAIAFVEANLAEPLTVPDIAAVSGISHNHLLRLFRAETGQTITGYVRRRRMERARHLLRESTLPIATVAASVGIPDPQAFNKACRRELGAAPRAIRSRTR